MVISIKMSVWSLYNKLFDSDYYDSVLSKKIIRHEDYEQLKKNDIVISMISIKNLMEVYNEMINKYGEYMISVSPITLKKTIIKYLVDNPVSKQVHSIIRTNWEIHYLTDVNVIEKLYNMLFFGNMKMYGVNKICIIII